MVSSPAKEAAGPAVDSSAALEKELAVLRDGKAKLSQEIALARKELDSTKAAAIEDRGKLEATVSDQTQKLAALSAELETARKDLAAVQSARAEAASLQEQVTNNSLPRRPIRGRATSWPPNSTRPAGIWCQPRKPTRTPLRACRSWRTSRMGSTASLGRRKPPSNN